MYSYKRIAITDRKIFWKSRKQNYQCEKKDIYAKDYGSSRTGGFYENKEDRSVVSDEDIIYIKYLAELARSVDMVILREKGMDKDKYALLAENFLKELALGEGSQLKEKKENLKPEESALQERPQSKNLSLVKEPQVPRKAAQIVLHTHIDIAVKINYKRIHLSMNVFRKNLPLLKEFELIGVSVHSLDEARFAQEHGADYVTASHIFQTECKKDLAPKGLDFLRNICENIKIPVYALGGITDDNELAVIRAGAFGACRMSDYMNGSMTAL